MDSGKTLQSANAFASEYDDYISKRGWIGPDILFEMLFEYLRADEKLLDLGIGTGLSSLPFHKAGLKIVGSDGSNEMLKICKTKHIAEELFQIDITKSSLPFEDESFDFVISHAVFHLTGLSDGLFSEIRRVIKKNGKFAFTFDEFKPEKDNDYKECKKPGIFEKLNDSSGIRIFKHSKAYIRELLAQNKFEILKQTEFLAFKDDEEGREVYFSLYLTEKIEP
jgi:predicted TPR repeat methyltransferase